MKEPYLWRRSNRTNPATNKAPIMLRIEIEGFDRAEFTTGVKATESEWNTAKQRIQLPRTASDSEQQLARLDNEKLENYIYVLRQAYNNYKSQGVSPSPADMREFLRGGKADDHTQKRLLVVAQKFYADMNRPERNRQPSTLKNLRVSIAKLTQYCQEHHKTTIQVDQITRAWCRQFERWCMGLQLGTESVQKHVSTLRRIVGFAADEGIIPASLVERYVYISEREKKDKRQLTAQELDLLEAEEFSNHSIQRVADLFIFCCYTGLSWIDYTRFARTPHEFLRKEENVLGIRMKRQKIIRKDKDFWVPLFPKAHTLFFTTYQQKLPCYSSMYISRILKRIAAQLADRGFHLQDLKHKDARSTFSQLMRDKYGPEVASGMAGHSKEMMDEYYSDTSPKRIVQQITILGGILTDN